MIEGVIGILTRPGLVPASNSVLDSYRWKMPYPGFLLLEINEGRQMPVQSSDQSDSNKEKEPSLALDE